MKTKSDKFEKHEKLGMHNEDEPFNLLPTELIKSFCLKTVS